MSLLNFDPRRGGGATMTGRILNGLYDYVAPVVETAVPGAGALVQLLRSWASGTGCRFYANNTVINLQLGGSTTQAQYIVLHTATETEVLPSMKLDMTTNALIFDTSLENPDAVPVEYAWLLCVIRRNQNLPDLYLSRPPSAQERHARSRNLTIPARARVREPRRVTRLDVPAEAQPLTTNRVYELKLPSITNNEDVVLDADMGLLVGYSDANEEYDDDFHIHPNEEVRKAASSHRQWAVDSGAYPGPVKLSNGDSIILMGAATDNPTQPERTRDLGGNPKIQLTGVFSWDLYKNTLDPAQFSEMQPITGNSASSGRFA